MSSRPKNSSARSNKYDRHLRVAEWPRSGVLGLTCDNESVLRFVSARDRAKLETDRLPTLGTSWIRVDTICLVDVALSRRQRTIRTQPSRISTTEDRAQPV